MKTTRLADFLNEMPSSVIEVKYHDREGRIIEEERLKTVDFDNAGVLAHVSEPWNKDATRDVLHVTLDIE
ncbi:MAG: hypothetical protein ACLFTZ_00945 [Acholeplasmataceae bacterium]